MEDQDNPPASPEDTAASMGHPQGEKATPGTAISWRRDLIAVLVAGTAFLVLVTVGISLPVMIWIACIVFLPVGVWMGWKSQRPWVDGTIYGTLGALVAFLILLGSGFSMGGFEIIYALVLALPQGILGAWLGARLAPANLARQTSAPAPEVERPPDQEE